MVLEIYTVYKGNQAVDINTTDLNFWEENGYSREKNKPKPVVKKTANAKRATNGRR